FVCGKGIYKSFVENYGSVDKFFPIDSYEFVFFFEKNNKVLKKFLENFDLIYAFCDRKEILGINLEENFTKEIIFHPIIKELNIHISDYLLQPIKNYFSKIEEIYRIKIDNKGKFYVIHPGSGNKSKNWNRENFLQLSKKLENVKILLGPAEEEEIYFWKENFKGEILINPSFDTIIEIAKETITYIGNDSGITHLFSITGVETIAIFGPTSPFIWGPKGENVKIIHKKVGCSPCKKEKMKQCKERKCLNSITIEDIITFLSKEKS
ncbi:MAG: glycosyltransferase family 9 protein, partial [bacterium]|nr:glycosyltransferase family 9 protein [bacterium]MDW8164073.1 glycosyltransferase family 9 protein [Candidatus Omnitrophota bacterium]